MGKSIWAELFGGAVKDAPPAPTKSETLSDLKPTWACFGGVPPGPPHVFVDEPDDAPVRHDPRLIAPCRETRYWVGVRNVKHCVKCSPKPFRIMTETERAEARARWAGRGWPISEEVSEEGE